MVEDNKHSFKKISYENQDFYLVPVKKMEEITGEKFTLSNFPVHLELPFKSNRTCNWNDVSFWKSHCGVIYKGQEISLEKLINIKELLVESELSKRYSEFLTVSTPAFDSVEVNYQELDELIEWFTSRISHEYKAREVTHYA